ncbi:hypothetical protein PPYR_05516 [Photinus pyralis]|uniref:FAD dependent oxidoreductase domain-containing protein n=1 Tax=Photinus pyralis TaxID=7054 RepID=A0A1Y1KYI3_PHOPY|nr:D-aspartate oxidase-like [Photinus pyralis]KAB0801162.1 hypothetical protein PPYR_05516 [Photinus pyralis]
MFNIAIIGGGVVGLSTANVIQDSLKSLAKITIYSENLSPNTTSDVAAGLWGPYLFFDTNPDQVLAWAKLTHKQFLNLWKNGSASEAGISLQSVKSVSGAPHTPFTTHINFGEHPMTPAEVDEMGQLLNQQFQSGVTFVTLACEPMKYLPYLLQRFLRNGGILKHQKVNSLDQLSHYDLIVNCCGLGASSLIGDTQMKPVRGQIMRVKAPWQFTSALVGSVYIIPNLSFTILGGTSQVDDRDTTVRDADTAKIIKGCKDLMPAIENAEVIEHKVGIRPGRVKVRLERETMSMNGKQMPVIHNYGHGGCGITLSYGTAVSATELVKEALNIPPMSKL